MFQGTLTALVTPFRGGAVDEKALRELVEMQIAARIDGLVPCGTTGESVTLEVGEHERVLKIVVDQAKHRVPVVAGAGTVSTHHTIELARTAKSAGVDGLLLVCPYYNRPTQSGLEAHFRAVLREVSLPTILYNIPGRTGVDLAVETLERLGDVREIVAVKEATGNVLRAQEILSKCGDRFVVLSGDDVLTLPMLAVGGKGVISVTSNLAPAEVGEVVRLFGAGQVDDARRRHLALVAAHQSMFIESNPGPIKAALAKTGRIAREIRLPLVWPSEATEQKVWAACRAARLVP